MSTTLRKYPCMVTVRSWRTYADPNCDLRERYPYLIDHGLAESDADMKRFEASARHAAENGDSCVLRVNGQDVCRYRARRPVEEPKCIVEEYRP
jgi:hypothetical protein